jgi:hypothetical protein
MQFENPVNEKGTRRLGPHVPEASQATTDEEDLVHATLLRDFTRVVTQH